MGPCDEAGAGRRPQAAPRQADTEVRGDGAPGGRGQGPRRAVPRGRLLRGLRAPGHPEGQRLLRRLPGDPAGGVRRRLRPLRAPTDPRLRRLGQAVPEPPVPAGRPRAPNRPGDHRGILRVCPDRLAALMPKFVPPRARDMARLLKKRLADRHEDDVYCEEALCGPGGAQRFDAWAMEPSWVRTRCPGYEVKVSRGDYVGDKKWTGYLDYCTEFYFVCPAGLIRPEELPPQVGLLWGTANGGKVYQKKPAIPREIDPEHLSVML